MMIGLAKNGAGTLDIALHWRTIGSLHYRSKWQTDEHP